MHSAEPGPATLEGELQCIPAVAMEGPVELRGVYVIERAPIMTQGMSWRLPDFCQSQKAWEDWDINASVDLF